MHDDHEAPGLGHNAKPPAQWQTPHRPERHGAPHDHESEPDLDLVEVAFVEGFEQASDPTSFIRLAGIPFVGRNRQGQKLHLLRVELESLTDIGAVSPLLGGQRVRYDPLPSRMVSRRRQLAFVYHDGKATVRLDFAEARLLDDETDAAELALGGT